jgi:hypothetical protein
VGGSEGFVSPVGVAGPVALSGPVALLVECRICDGLDMIQHATSFALPVMGLEAPEGSSSAKAREMCGTAFTIGGGAYLTAGHVCKQARAHPLQAIGMMDEPETEAFKLVKVTHAEVLEAVDLGVLKASHSFGTTFRWSRAPASLLDTVETYGYPYGFDAESEMLTVRAFKGTVVGGGPLRRVPAQPPAWEVSFPCPRGLSGAPLIRTDPQPTQIIGVILGNNITEMVVYTEKETLLEHGRDQTLIKTEALHLGVAIKAEVVLNVMSSLLGCTIVEWLSRHGIFAD